MRPSQQGSVSHWLEQLKSGDGEAAQNLWERYFYSLVELARGKLRPRDRRAADQEDVALSAFDSFFEGAARGRFPQLSDRNDLWRLLVVITARKAYDLIEREQAKKRGGGQKIVGEAELAGPNASWQALDQVVGAEPTPEFAAQVAEECQRLLSALDDETLKAVALDKMEGYTNEEIADRLGCVPRTIERKLRVIRSLWAQEFRP